jgi:hypothetical protein
MKWIIVITGVLVGMILGEVVRADQFDDELAKYVAKTAAFKADQKAATCECGCAATGKCVCKDCDHVKDLKDKKQVLCGCGSDRTKCVCDPVECLCIEGGRSCQSFKKPEIVSKTFVGTVVYDYRGYRLMCYSKTLQLKSSTIDFSSFRGKLVSAVGELGDYAEPQVQIFTVKVMSLAGKPTEPVKSLPAAPSTTFLHDCGCPSLACNCGAGGCHCAPNRQVNRQPARWVPDGGRWYLYRGNQCLGAINGKGSFYLWNGSEYMSEPCKPPLPAPRGEPVSYVPRQRSLLQDWQTEPLSMVRVSPVCRS